VLGVQRSTEELSRYELVDEDGERIGDLTSEDSSVEVGDLVPCGGHVFEVRELFDSVLHVRRVI
jgi:hypothetical protein